MKRLALVIAVMLMLVVPSIAQAHFDYYNVTLQAEASQGDSNAAWQISLGCWQTAQIDPGQTRYIIHDGNQPNGDGFYVDQGQVQSVGSRHWGIATFDNWHWHPANWSDWDTGFATRVLQGPSGGISSQATTVRTRRIFIPTEAAFTGHVLVKFVNDGPGYANIRANC